MTGTISPSQAAEQSGFSLDTLRYYERIGLLDGKNTRLGTSPADGKKNMITAPNGRAARAYRGIPGMMATAVCMPIQVALHPRMRAHAASRQRVVSQVVRRLRKKSRAFWERRGSNVVSVGGRVHLTAFSGLTTGC